jgi:hypothetical protein
MCDFRKIKAIRIDNKILKYDHVPEWNWYGHNERGFYHVAASGSYYCYFDGQNWLYEPDWEVVDD